MPRHPRGVLAGDSNQAKTRRSHRKSRNGCSECKRRHIRCDEGRPACTNCSIAERACSYPPKAAAAASSSSSAGAAASASASASVAAAAAAAATPPAQHGQANGPSGRPLSPQHHSHNLRSHPLPSHVVSPASDVANAAAAAASTSSRQDHVSSGRPSEQPPDPSELGTVPLLPSLPLAEGAYLYTPQHLALLLHAHTRVANTMLGSRGNGAVIVTIALRHAVDSPYLIDELLAVSAMHLALTLPPPSTPSSFASSDAASYRRQATELQTRALASFTREADMLGAAASVDSTYIPRFLFSAMLAIHVLADCLTRDPAADFHAFVDGFVDCILLHHGVRTMTSPNWPALIQSEIRDLLIPALEGADYRQRRQGDPITPDAECAPLEDLLQKSDLGAASIDACKGAVQTLQYSFDMQAALADLSAPNPSSAFAVTVSADYVNVLRKHRPEALIILAYYGIILHRSRNCWVFGDSGARLIRAISCNLGSFWQDALKWPLEVIEKEVDV